VSRSRSWSFINRVKGTQTYGFFLHPRTLGANGEILELGLCTTNKAEGLMHSEVRIPANDADIDRLCAELKRMTAGPLGQLAIDADTTTTTVMEN
jgi:hypothetical protein